MTEKDRKAALVQALTDHVLTNGLGGASLRQLAATVGTSDRMLLYYFPDKPALIAAILEDVAARMNLLLESQRRSEPVSADTLEARLLPLVLDPMVWPFMQLWLEMAAMAARGDETCTRVGGGIAQGFLAWLEEQLDVADPAERAQMAVRLLMTIEGAALLKSLGLGAHITA